MAVALVWLLPLAILIFVLRRAHYVLSRIRSTPGIPRYYCLINPFDPWGYLFKASPGNPTIQHVWAWKDRYEKRNCEVMQFVSLFPGEVITYCASPEAIKQLLSDPFKYVKPPKALIIGVMGPNVISLNTERWRTHRKVTSPAFDNQIYNDVWRITAGLYKEMVNSTPWKSGDQHYFKSFNVFTTRLALLVIASCGFNLKVDWEGALMRDGFEEPVDSTIVTVANGLLPRLLLPKWAFKLPLKFLQANDTSFTALESFLNAEVSSKKAELYHEKMLNMLDTSNKNLFTRVVLSSMVEGPKGLSDDEIIGNLFIYLFAGHETTASALATTLALLAINKEEQQWVHDCIVNAIGMHDPEYTNYEDLAPVLHCFYEAIRLYPPAPIVVRMPTEDTVFAAPQVIPGSNTFPLPRDQEIVIDFIAAGRNTRIYKDPDAFYPRRWASPDLSADEMLSFGVGPRVCLGKKFSMTESVCFLTHVLRDWKFDVKLENGETRAEWQDRIMKPYHTFDLNDDVRLKPSTSNRRLSLSLFTVKSPFSNTNLQLKRVEDAMQSDAPVADVKEFIDRAVQTDTPKSSRPTSPEHSSSLVIKELSERLSDMDISASSMASESFSRLESSADAESGAYNPDNSSVLSSPLPTIKTSARIIKRAHVENGQSSRIVSMPETVSAFSAKRALEKTPRVVSNPEGLRNRIRSPADSSYSEQQSADAFENERPARIRVRSTATDTPHTPSPPSSPDSIEIIANNSRLPEAFLRGNAHTEGSPLSSGEPDDDGWISWAKSPPRPIPALHGPLSLPYARCPSGAEGTVIEEPDELPRVIWGLEGEDASHRPRSEPVNHVTHPSVHPPPQTSSIPAPSSLSTVPQRALPRQQHSVPPRFHAHSTQENSFRALPSAQEPQETRGGRQLVAPLRHMARSENLQYEYSLPEHGPIDLTSVLRPRLDGNKKYLQDPELSGSLAYGSIGNDYRVYHSPEQIDLGWQSLLSTQERLKNLTLSSVDSTHGYMKPSSSLSSLASSRSPIILDSPSHLSPMSWSVSSQHSLPPTPNTPRRMSALEIAQSYRQQQLLQDRRKHQSALPTPPNSSSPLWSSGFSPYQESLLSPEILTGAHPNILHKALSPAQRQQNYIRQQEIHASRQFDYESTNELSFGPRKHAEYLFLPHGTHNHENSLQRDGPYRNSNVDLSLISAPSRLRQMRVPAQLNVQRSPAPPPRPPPNTPSTATFRDVRQAQSHIRPPAAPAPLSPTSPKSRQNIPQQHPRSIPLSRLIQRRLSSVPEEDSGIMSDYIPSAPEPFVDQRHRPAGSMNEFATQKDAGLDMDRNARDTPGGAVDAVQAPQGRDVKVRDNSSQRSEPKEVKAARGGRARGRGGRPRRGRVPLSNVVNGPERANGSMTVHS
ncbi:hypothetical protein NM688_g2393 [Phlebia brevispora]|uniref:Uncharacterized protein n=1 Tax=Phlebia brevispora TaxID=194682 RepID=A0ACC1T8V9_9APHY|nr:hypothetical protein NM688_g2393 [Phlebia brevispora]